MQKFHLELLFQIIGIGSASGLFYKDHSVFVISDNGSNLYEYYIGSKILEKSPLIESEITKNIPKKQKPDFESIASHGDTLFVFGSGSTENRNKMITVDRRTKKVLRKTDISDLYSVMQSFANIKPEDFNIEGVVNTGEEWYFFQRGNGGTGKNGIFTVKGNIRQHEFSVLYNEMKLPKIKGIETSFTDAVFANGSIYFLATAENTKTAYDDGEILGSLIGRLDIEKMKIKKTQQITDKHKFEGISLFQENDKQLLFLLCEDNDSDVLESGIFQLTIPK